jgi:hypothetical protein
MRTLSEKQGRKQCSFKLKKNLRLTMAFSFGFGPGFGDALVLIFKFAGCFESTF